MSRVALVAYPLASQGGVYQWCNRFKEVASDHEVICVAGSRPDPDAFRDWVWNVPVHGVRDLPRAPTAEAARRIGHCLRSARAELALTAHPYSAVAVAQARALGFWSGPHVMVVHSHLSGGLLRRMGYQTAFLTLSRWINRVAVVSPHLRVEQPLTLRRRTIWMRNWVPDSYERLAPSVDRDSILYAGRIEPGKGLEVLGDVARANPEAALVVAGDGSLRSELEAELADLPNVRFIGWQSDLRAWLDRARVLVLPSRREGANLTIAEASRRGVLPLVTDIPSFREAGVPSLLRARSAEQFVSISRSLLALSQAELERLQNEVETALSFFYSLDSAREDFAHLIEGLI